jgi:hypothetical protein
MKRDHAAAHRHALLSQPGPACLGHGEPVAPGVCLSRLSDRLHVEDVQLSAPRRDRAAAPGSGSGIKSMGGSHLAHGFFDLPETLQDLERRLRALPYSAGFRPFKDAEADAVMLELYEPLLVTGVIQGEDYMAKPLTSTRT